MTERPVSPDGYWEWDGQAWVPRQVAAQVPADAAMQAQQAAQAQAAQAQAAQQAAAQAAQQQAAAVAAQQAAQQQAAQQQAAQQQAAQAAQQQATAQQQAADMAAQQAAYQAQQAAYEAQQKAAAQQAAAQGAQASPYAPPAAVAAAAEPYASPGYAAAPDPYAPYNPSGSDPSVVPGGSNSGASAGTGSASPLSLAGLIIGALGIVAFVVLVFQYKSALNSITDAFANGTTITEPFLTKSAVYYGLTAITALGLILAVLGEKASHAAGRTIVMASIAISAVGFGMWGAWAISRAVLG